MCGRYYYADKVARKVEKELFLEIGSFVVNEGDVTPGMDAPVIILDRMNSEECIVSQMFWGIMSNEKKLIINARAESVQERSMFSNSIEKRRCVIPASGFYEWDSKKTKYIFERTDNGPIYLAGFYDLSNNRDSFVILTTEANDSMKKVHNRMPVMIEKECVQDYLNDYTLAIEMLKKPMPELKKSCDYEQISLF